MSSYKFWNKKDTPVLDDDDVSAAPSRSERMSAFSNTYELSNMSRESSYSGAHSSVYSDPYGDNVPLRENAQPFAHNPWGPQTDQLPPDMPPPGFATPLSQSDQPQLIPEKPKRRLPWFVIIFSTIQITSFVGDLILMARYTGNIVQTKPTFSPMIGPSTYVLVHVGARFTPCMRKISGVTDDLSLEFPCPNSTTTATNVCSLSELCGMGGVGTAPHQWWRFITPIFVHAGFIHIIINLLLQFQIGIQIERRIGSWKFAFIYLMCGVNGFILGGNYTPNGIASTGASGSLFGLVALNILDLLYNWKTYESPKRTLFWHGIEVIVYLAMGLLPGIDNFSHIGGFLMGLMLGIVFLPSPMKIRGVSGVNPAVYYYSKPTTWKERFTNWRIALTGRHPLWYLWVLVRIAMFLATAMLFFVLIRNFYNGGGHCSWCKYLSCLPINGWCDTGDIST